MDLDDCRALRCRRMVPNKNPFEVRRHYGIGAVLFGHKCLIFGGYKGFKTPARFVYVYNTVSNSWKKLEAANYGLVFGRVKMAFVLDDSLIAYVWHKMKHAYNLVNLNLVLLSEWQSVHQKDPPKIGIGTAGCYIEARNEAVVVGGKGGPKLLVYVYVVAASSWYRPEVKGKAPNRRMNHAVCSSGSNMFVVGGTHLSLRDDFKLDLHILTMRGREFVWSSPKIPGYAPRDRYLFQATSSGKRIFVYGGYNGVTSFDFYDIAENRWRSAGGSGKENGVKYITNWSKGTSEYASVQTRQTLWIFGGFQLDPYTPLKITAR